MGETGIRVGRESGPRLLTQLAPYKQETLAIHHISLLISFNEERGNQLQKISSYSPNSMTYLLGEVENW